MIDAQTIAEAITKLRAAGVEVPAPITLTALVHLIERTTRTHRSRTASQSDYIRVYLRPKAAPAQMPPFTPLVTTPHPRAAEIDVLPRQIGTGGVGNGPENSPVWTR